jgi:hypothetical protein
MLRRKLEMQLAASVERIWDLPPLMVIYTGGEYLKLLREARDLYVDGYFYSCVATCGIVSERIIKDILCASIKIEKDGIVETPENEVIEELEQIDVFRIAKLLRKTELLSRETFKAVDNLVQLRNKYAHARGREAQTDALNAIKLLHQVVEGTVSVFKTHEIRQGKFVRKTRDKSAK